MSKKIACPKCGYKRSVRSRYYLDGTPYSIPLCQVCSLLRRINRHKYYIIRFEKQIAQIIAKRQARKEKTNVNK